MNDFKLPSTSAGELRDILARIMGVSPQRISIEVGDGNAYTIGFSDEEDERASKIFAKHMARFTEMALAQFGCQVTGRQKHEA